ncbi:MAG: hypothetical protein ABIR84_06085 [Candidatus Nitrotoga sp.]
MKPNSCLTAIFALAALMVALPAAAHSPNDIDPNALRSLVQQSAAVVQGKVVDIDYRNSEPTREQPYGLPHTFVTYEVEQVARGSLESKRLVLKVPGGADGSGGFYTETSAPTFARGQQDILFVLGGKIESCQLVNCADGRFRVIDGRVYNTWGVPLVEARKQLRFGGKPRFDLNVIEVPRPDFDQLMKRPEAKARIEKEGGDLRALRKRYEEEAPKFYTVNMAQQPSESSATDKFEEKPAEPSEKFDQPIAAAEFLKIIQELENSLGKPRQKVVMANPKLKFKVADPKMELLKAVREPRIKISDEERDDKSAIEEEKEDENELRPTPGTITPQPGTVIPRPVKPGIRSGTSINPAPGTTTQGEQQ